MEIDIHNLEGKTTGAKMELADDVFGIEPNDHAIHLDIRLITAHQRQGTHKVKTRGEVSGSTKKPFKQKGTGNARQGHKRSPLFRHGGTMFGPEPRDYGFKLNKKVKKLARKSALSYKAQESAIVVLEHMQFETNKTKYFAGLLKTLNLDGHKTLFVIADKLHRIAAESVAHVPQADPHANAILSGRNLPKVTIARASDLNTYDILNADRIVFEKDAVATLNTVFA